MFCPLHCFCMGSLNISLWLGGYSINHFLCVKFEIKTQSVSEHDYLRNFAHVYTMHKPLHSMGMWLLYT